MSSGLFICWSVDAIVVTKNDWCKSGFWEGAWGGQEGARMVKHFEDWKRFKPKKFQFLELNSCYSLLRWISKTTKDWEFFFVLHLTVESVHDQLKRDTLPLSREELIGGATRVEISRQNSQGLLSVAWESHLFPTSLQYCTHLNWGLCITGKRVYINSWIQDLSIYYWSFFHGCFHLRFR